MATVRGWAGDALRTRRLTRRSGCMQRDMANTPSGRPTVFFRGWSGRIRALAPETARRAASLCEGVRIGFSSQCWVRGKAFTRLTSEHWLLYRAPDRHEGLAGCVPGSSLATATAGLFIQWAWRDGARDVFLVPLHSPSDAQGGGGSFDAWSRLSCTDWPTSITGVSNCVHAFASNLPLGVSLWGHNGQLGCPWLGEMGSWRESSNWSLKCTVASWSDSRRGTAQR